MIRQQRFRATGPQRPRLFSARWSVGALAAASLIGLIDPAGAAPSRFWDFNSSYDDGEEPVLPPPPKRRVKAYPKPDAKLEKQLKQAAKPQGPLVIAVSIAQQTIKVYDANGLFAESPVSTGMRGHSTPMGVFSVIQKNKYHRSNLYSGAPMPYMQRITWSGVAMHAGALPGYPASHGCIRMPMSFAQKMWSWTRMGARVVITPGEIAPESFTHPLLVAQKPAPMETTAQPEPATDGAAGKVANAVGPDLQLRPALSPHGDAASVGALPQLPKRAPVRTADASGATTNASPTASDAGSRPASDASRPDGEAPKADAKAENKPEPKDNAKADASVDSKSEPAKTDAAALPEPKRSGQIAAFVSRKDSRLYVRQGFAPLFDVPVEIAASDRPLGTHIFTARLDKDNPSAIAWSVVTLPAVTHRAEASEDDRTPRRRKIVGAVETTTAPQPSSAAEALDRLKIPADAMTRIAEALSTGGSLIVSDQGIASGETGQGTDFIIPLRPAP
uniref:ErfK/YbiS/YcfS/YnhG family protein n=1 Tax=Rhodopseudomonas palustris (strain BisA53) TaxID=316055 RepID=Q07NZ7_RHOP5